jgi:hypothetical protein
MRCTLACAACATDVVVGAGKQAEKGCKVSLSENGPLGRSVLCAQGSVLGARECAWRARESAWRARESAVRVSRRVLGAQGSVLCA